jgi:hypothetical protein
MQLRELRMILLMSRNMLIDRAFIAASRWATKYHAKTGKTRPPNDNRTLGATHSSVENLCSANNLRSELLRV